MSEDTHTHREELRPATWLGYAMDKMGDESDGVPLWKLELFAHCLQNILNQNAPKGTVFIVQSSTEKIMQDATCNLNAPYVKWCGDEHALKWADGGHKLWIDRQQHNTMFSNVVPQYVDEAWIDVLKVITHTEPDKEPQPTLGEPIDALTSTVNKSGLTAMMNIRRMGYIRRCNNYPTMVDDTVAAHSYNVALMSWAAAVELNANGMQLNLECLLTKALAHDVPEAFTGDVQYHVKHNNPQIETGFNIATRRIVESAFVCVDNSSGAHAIRRASENCKDRIEGQLVALCDMLDLAIYSYEELMRGNVMFKAMLRHALHYLDAESGLLKPFVDDCGKLRSNLLQSALDLLTSVPMRPTNTVSGLYEQMMK